jgi:hypothetical protein
MVEARAARSAEGTPDPRGRRRTVGRDHPLRRFRDATWEEVALANAESWLDHEIEKQRVWLNRVGPSIPENIDLPA